MRTLPNNDFQPLHPINGVAFTDLTVGTVIENSVNPRMIESVKTSEIRCRSLDRFLSDAAKFRSPTAREGGNSHRRADVPQWTDLGNPCRCPTSAGQAGFSRIAHAEMILIMKNAADQVFCFAGPPRLKIRRYTNPEFGQESGTRQDGTSRACRDSGTAGWLSGRPTRIRPFVRRLVPRWSCALTRRLDLQFVSLPFFTIAHRAKRQYVGPVR